MVRLFALGCLLVAVGTLQAQPQHGVGRNPFDEVDKNNDGKISGDEFKGPDRVFAEMDADNDGYVSRQEMQDFHQKREDKKPGIEKNEDRGPYPDLIIKKYDKDRTWQGNVIFVDKNRSRIVEADLEGKIVWECTLSGTSLLTDVELLPDDNVLVLNGGDGVYEVNRECKVVWSYHNKNVSHDADRLKNGNTLIACVGSEKASEFPYKDPQAIEVDPRGEIVWAWYAKKEYADSKYKDIRSMDANDWTHMNSVQRLDDGNTLLSVRNWNLLIAVDGNGLTKWKTGAKEVPKQGWGKEPPSCPHTAVLLDNGNIIISESMRGRAIEWDPKQEKVVWKYPDRDREQGGPHYFVRASHRLPNGNTFIIDSKGQFLEVTSGGELVWHARLADYTESSEPLAKEDVRKVPCFNADRRGMPFFGGR